MRLINANAQPNDFPPTRIKITMIRMYMELSIDRGFVEFVKGLVTVWLRFGKAL